MPLAACFWFPGSAGEALSFYERRVPGFSIRPTHPLTAAQAALVGAPEGQPLTYDFRIFDLDGVAMGHAPGFVLNPSLSLHLSLQDEQALRELWAALADGGTVMMPLQPWPWSPLYGWVQDRFGLSWQLTLTESGSPSAAPALLFTGPSYGRAEQAIERYTDLFDPGRTLLLSKHDGSGPDPDGELQYAEVELHGQKVIAVQGGGPEAHPFTFNEAGSLVVRCADQREIDHFWHGLTASPEAEQCGWLKDRYGLSWQIVPAELVPLLFARDEDQGLRTMRAMLGMKKLDLDALRGA
ncbi:MAG: VOC family protein [Deltaproteobacteria bacterium]|nr:MAG: VOC family protein [Deltaproteobacteria bacterium]